MKKNDTPVVDRSLFSWIFSGDVKLQFLLIGIILITVFARVLPLEMQKRIVNQAIFLRKIDLLLLYSGIYLAAVVASGGLKFLITYLESLIGERALAEMRKALYHHILTLPINFFRKTQPGMVVSALVSELASSGTFVGQAVSAPVTNILTLLAFAAYLIWLNWLLAIVSLSIYPAVTLLLPQLQKRANKANKKRVDATRTISNKIAEAVTGIHEVHGNGAYRIENRKFDKMVEKLFKIRLVWILYRQAVKVSNNFFNNLSPFLIFILGGYLAMNGRLELGALVAFLSAQEKLFTPWKELIEFYQLYQDAAVTYKRTMEYFHAFPEHAIVPDGRKPLDLEGRIETKDLSFVTDSGIQLLRDINLSLKQGEHLALVGFSGSGKSTLALCIGQLLKYTGGSVKIGEKEVSELSKMDIVQNIGFVSQSPFIFDGTIEENLLYSCLARQSGNSAGGDSALPNRDDIISVLQQTGVFLDVLRFGLNTILVHNQHDELVSAIIRVRRYFQQDFEKVLSDYVEFYHQEKYLYFSDIAENITFGSPRKDTFRQENLTKNTYFLEFLDKVDLMRPLLTLGAELTRQTVDILGNMPPDELFFQQSPIAIDALETYKGVSEELKRKKLHQISSEGTRLLLELALRFTPGRHKMVGFPTMLERLILEGRVLFREKIIRDDPEAFSFFEAEQYIYSQTILNNIFFGRTKTNQPKAQDKIYQSIIHLLIEEDLLETIVEIGMQFQVGSKGDKLSGGQRQKLAIARVFLKNPRILIMDEATSALDNNSQARIQSLLETQWKGNSTLIAVVHRLDIIKNYDKIAVMKAGKIVEMGNFNELLSKKGMLYELIGGKT
ncbi:MAG: ATP-binding cassette domain-containing protein [Desulfobacteraceae bacterium]|nr:MAG: ATP-binding cassette domain-containing protein [Desulfobacteraceae bacterium]